MKKLIIKTPIWKYKVIGIPDWKTKYDYEISIAYKNKEGKRLYPDTYIITKEEIKRYPLKYLGRLWVYLIPIEKLRIKERRNEIKKKKTA